MTKLLQQYRTKVIPALREEFGYANVMQVPKVTKVTVNVGTGRVAKEPAMLERIEHDLAALTGQKAAVRKAKKSVSSFKVRQGMPVGLSVTLRGARMYDFIDRLVNVALPLSKDFRGIDPKNVDADGNLNLGIREQNIFPEVTFESTRDLFSLQVTVTTTARNRERGIALLKQLGFPFKK